MFTCNPVYVVSPGKVVSNKACLRIVTKIEESVDPHLLDRFRRSCLRCGRGRLCHRRRSGDKKEERDESLHMLLEFAEPPLFGELDQRRFHFPAIEADADEIEIVVAGEIGDVLLPLFDAVRHARELTA